MDNLEVIKAAEKYANSRFIFPFERLTGEDMLRWHDMVAAYKAGIESVAAQPIKKKERIIPEQSIVTQPRNS